MEITNESSVLTGVSNKVSSIPSSIPPMVNVGY